MKRFCSCARWIGLGLALVLSPALIVFAAPFGYGVLYDLTVTAWLAPVSLTFAATISLNAVRRGALQAAKSIT